VTFLEVVFDNYFYLGSITIFLIGFHTLLTHSNLIKKVIGMNIMETAIFLFIVSIGYIRDRHPPIVVEGEPHMMINPLPSALVLTGIVVGVSLTAFALSLIVKLYKYYGTVDIDEIMEIRSRES